MAKRNPYEHHRPNPGRAPTGIEDFDRRLNPEQRKELEALRQHEPRILKALEDPEMHALFLRDPGAALEKMGVPVTPYLRGQLRKNTGMDRLTQPRQFLTPGGQTVSPKVKIHITRMEGKGEESNHGR